MRTILINVQKIKSLTYYLVLIYYSNFILATVLFTGNTINNNYLDFLLSKCNIKSNFFLFLKYYVPI